MQFKRSLTVLVVCVSFSQSVYSGIASPDLFGGLNIENNNFSNKELMSIENPATFDELSCNIPNDGMGTIIRYVTNPKIEFKTDIEKIQNSILAYKQYFTFDDSNKPETVDLIESVKLGKRQVMSDGTFVTMVFLKYKIRDTGFIPETITSATLLNYYRVKDSQLTQKWFRVKDDQKIRDFLDAEEEKKEYFFDHADQQRILDMCGSLVIDFTNDSSVGYFEQIIKSNIRMPGGGVVKPYLQKSILEAYLKRFVTKMKEKIEDPLFVPEKENDGNA